MTLDLDAQELASNLGPHKHEHETRERDEHVLTGCRLGVVAQKLLVGRDQNDYAKPKEAGIKVH